MKYTLIETITSLFYICCNFINITFFPKSYAFMQKSKIELWNERNKIICFYIELKALETNFKHFLMKSFIAYLKTIKHETSLKK